MIDHDQGLFMLSGADIFLNFQNDVQRIYVRYLHQPSLRASHPDPDKYRINATFPNYETIFLPFTPPTIMKPQVALLLSWTLLLQPTAAVSKVTSSKPTPYKPGDAVLVTCLNRTMYVLSLPNSPKIFS